MKALLAEVRACRVCEADLPLGPRPVLRLSPEVRLLLIGQAPGTRVHASGTPWDDASGERLRAWLGMAPEQFYDERRIGIMPMGFCYPGVQPAKGKQGGGDKPPRPECAPLWHARLLAGLPELRLTLLIGTYALAHYLGRGTMTEQVRLQPGLPRYFALPHPSWRIMGWAARNPWFEAQTLPRLRDVLSAAQR